MDCVGILKLRNADVEARIGVAGSKKKSTRARLAFRVNIPEPDGSVHTLQVLSSPILCSEYPPHTLGQSHATNGHIDAKMLRNFMVPMIKSLYKKHLKMVKVI